MSEPRRVVVVGGGITGLAAAHAAARQRRRAEVTLFEAGDRLGGKIRTTPFAGLPAVDEGADAFLARVPWAIELARERRARRPADLAAQRQGRGVVGRPARHPRRPAAGDADRLLGLARTRTWFFPTGTRALGTGRLNGDLRVRLSPDADAWVPVADARPLPAGVPAPHAVVSSVNVTPSSIVSPCESRSANECRFRCSRPSAI